MNVLIVLAILLAGLLLGVAVAVVWVRLERARLDRRWDEAAARRVATAWSWKAEEAKAQPRTAGRRGERR